MQPTRTEQPAYIVAFTRWADGCVLDEELAPLAQALGLGLYDARLRLATPLPIVLAHNAGLEHAQLLLSVMRERGHGVVACDAHSVPSEADAFVARSVELSREALVVTDRPGRAFSLPWPELLGMFRASEVSTELETSQVTRQQLALGRAALSGGLVRSKSVTSVERRENIERQEALYLFRRSGPAPVVLRERELDYEALGEHRGASTRQSFATLIEWLRHGAPHAIYDEHLVSAKRRADVASVQGGASKQLTASSNSAANQQAAYLLMHAHLQGQV